MLAGISHDLRTPLTRMRLALAMLPRRPEIEEDLAALTQDVEEMERMIAAYLAFARGEGTEQAQPADLVELVQDVAANARRAGAAVEVAANGGALVMPLRPDAVRRCLGNLLDNARRHARRIAVAVDAVPRGAALGGPSGGGGGGGGGGALGAGDGGRRRAGHPGGGARGRLPPLPERRRRAAPASASPSRATSSARMAATSCWSRARSAGCAPGSGCRCSGGFGHVADRLDLQPAIHRRAAGLHAGARRQRFGVVK